MLVLANAVYRSRAFFALRRNSEVITITAFSKYTSTLLTGSPICFPNFGTHYCLLSLIFLRRGQESWDLRERNLTLWWVERSDDLHTTVLKMAEESQGGSFLRASRSAPPRPTKPRHAQYEKTQLTVSGSLLHHCLLIRHQQRLYLLNFGL